MGSERRKICRPVIHDIVLQLTAWFDRADARSRGVLGILRDTLKRLSIVHAPEAAASLAYYAIFTLFPLLLLLVAGGASFLRSDIVQEQVVEWINAVLPVVNQDLVRESVTKMMAQSASIRLIGLVALVWSASSFFAGLALNINRAFPAARPGSVIRHRLLALLVVLVVLVLFILSLIASGTANVLRRAGIIRFLPVESLGTTASQLLPWVVTLLMFAAIYRWMPIYRASWRATFTGALVATIAWQAAATAFGWAVSGGLINYELVYGSLAAFVALLFWIYLSCFIILFGAHLAGAIDATQRARRDI
jgi:membrane protein